MDIFHSSYMEQIQLYGKETCNRDLWKNLWNNNRSKYNYVLYKH